MHWRSDGKARPRTQLLPTPSEASTRARLMSTLVDCFVPSDPWASGKGLYNQASPSSSSGALVLSRSASYACDMGGNLSVVSCVLSGLRLSGRKGQTSAGPAAPAAGTHAGSVPETELLGDSDTLQVNEAHVQLEA